MRYILQLVLVLFSIYISSLLWLKIPNFFSILVILKDTIDFLQRCFLHIYSVLVGTFYIRGDIHL